MILHRRKIEVGGANKARNQFKGITADRKIILRSGGKLSKESLHCLMDLASTGVLKGALVFIDDCIAEGMRCNGGIELMLRDFKVESVQDFECAAAAVSMSNGDRVSQSTGPLPVEQDVWLGDTRSTDCHSPLLSH